MGTKIGPAVDRQTEVLSGGGAPMMGAMRIDWLPFLVVFLVLTIVVGGTLLGLYALFNRFLAFLEKHDK